MVEGCDDALRAKLRAKSRWGGGKRDMRVLIAEDDPALGLFLQRGFESHGHRVKVVRDGYTAVEAYESESPDLTILDLNLPRKDGETALGEMRRLDEALPIMILTGRRDLECRVRCLEHGADDLMLKPFSFMELRARCAGLLRRTSCANVLLRAGDLELNRMDRTVTRAGQQVALTNKEFALLEFFLRNPETILRASEFQAVIHVIKHLQTILR